MTLSVLHVAQPRDAGVPRAAASLVADQVARGWRVSVASPADGELRSAAETAGAGWHAWTASREPGPGTIAETRRLAQIVRRTDPALVHLHSAKAGLAGRLAIRGNRVTVFQPHAWSFEAPENRLIRRASIAWERLGARWSDAIVCVSTQELRRGEEAGVRGPLVHIRNGVDLTAYRPASSEDRATARAGLGFDPDTPLVVTVGRLTRQKGQDVLLDAWPRVRSVVPGARLVLVGDGPDRAALEARAVPGVSLAGPTGEVWRWLAAATVVAQPSRWEGMSLLLLEALATARGVVITDVAGMRDVVVDGTGAVVPPGDAESLADAIIERLRDPATADREGAAGRRHVEQHYSWDGVCAQMAALYDRALTARQG